MDRVSGQSCSVSHFKAVYFCFAVMVFGPVEFLLLQFFEWPLGKISRRHSASPVFGSYNTPMV